jgi:hypothetical protein
MAREQEQPCRSNSGLYDGEKLGIIADYPVLTKFIPGDGDISKPLIVFLPGLAHNARIAYGGHDGSCKEDFLAHWFHRHGYPFLGISYPLDTDPEIMPPTGSEFSLRDWGRQAAATMRMIVDEQELSPKLVILAWSMAGKALAPVMTEATARELTVSLYVSLAATPALWGLRQHLRPCHIPLTRAGYWNNVPLHHRFTSQLLEQNRVNNGHIAIDEEIFKREYFGSTPIAPGGWGYRYKKQEKKLVEDKWALLEDGRIDEYERLPPLAALYPTSPLDWRHSLTDRANWGYLIVQKYVAMAQKVKESREPRTEDSAVGRRNSAQRDRTLLDRLRASIYGIPDRMITGVEGNHYFFVGALGARTTAEKVIQFIEDIKQVHVELDNILNAQD